MKMGAVCEPAMLAAILDDPLDDAKRSVYADYLSQHGDPRGELIALELAPGKSAHRTRKLNPLRDQFEREVWRSFGLDGHYAQVRGFIHEVSAEARDLVTASRLFESEPVSSLVVTRAAGWVTQILQLPLQRLRSLEVHENLSVSDVAALVRASMLHYLERLALIEANLAVQGAEMLAGARVRPRQLVLPGADLTDAGFAKLLAGDILDNVEVLDVSDCYLSAPSVVALAEARRPRLRRLDLSFNALDEAATVALCESPALANLEQLVVENAFVSAELESRARARFGERLVVERH